MGMDIKVSDNGGKTLKLDQAEFIDRCSQSQDSGINVAAMELEKVPTVCLLGSNMDQKWPALNGVEMPDLP